MKHERLRSMVIGGQNLIEDRKITWGRLLGFFLLKFFLLRLFEKSPKLKKPPNADRLMVAALAAKGLNSGLGFGNGFSICGNDPSESGTTPSLPWKTRNAVSKLGPSSKIGPLAPLAFTSSKQCTSATASRTYMIIRNTDSMVIQKRRGK